MANSDYALQSWDELHELLKVPGYFEYASKVYAYLARMKPGTVIKLVASPDRLPWLIKSVHVFLRSEEHWREYDFNDDMTKFRRVDIPRYWERRSCVKRI